MYIIYLLLALLTGMTISIQGVINSTGASIIGLPAMLAFLSFVQAVPSLTYILIKKPAYGVAGSFIRGWKWFLMSGLFAAATVILMTLSITKIGTLTAFVLVILGQIISSAIADHFGLFGIERKPINKMKLISMMIIFAGVALLVMSDLGDNVAFIFNFEPGQIKSFKG